MKATYLRPLRKVFNAGTPEQRVEMMPAGYIHEAPDVYRLVQHGCAIPADDECREACGMTEEDMAKAQKSYKRTAAGIDPDDYQAFDDGLMIGYDPKGNSIPGPNAEQAEDLEDDETDDFDDEAVSTE